VSFPHYGPCERLAEMPDDLVRFLALVGNEVMRARKKFPKPHGLMTALTEEVGEVAKALLDEPWSRVEEEAVQAAAMCARLALETDPTLTPLRTKRGVK